MRFGFPIAAASSIIANHQHGEPERRAVLNEGSEDNRHKNGDNRERNASDQAGTDKEKASGTANKMQIWYRKQQRHSLHARC